MAGCKIQKLPFNSPYKVHSCEIYMMYNRGCIQIHPCPPWHVVFCHLQKQPYLMHKQGNPQETFGGRQVPKFWFDRCPQTWICVPKTTCCHDSSTSWQDEITCWCLTRCLTSYHSHTYHTPGLKRVAEVSPASSCPDLTVEFPRMWCWCLLILAWLDSHQALMCSASLSALECSSCLAPCHWCLYLSGNKWRHIVFHHFTGFKYPLVSQNWYFCYI